jgi:uncharacterized protein
MSFRAEIIESISDVPPAEWDALADVAANPFLRHAFLHALEKSGSATVQTGWAAHHVLLRDDKTLVGAVPCYRKTHSQGEYVFDHGWAEAFHRAGGHYYPKLQVSVPFTPATGPRLLAKVAEHRKLLAGTLVNACAAVKASSVHITFAQAEEQAACPEDWLLREDIQFHWRNGGYATYDDFLGTLASAKRKNLRKERKAVADAGITFEHLSGAALTENHWDHFFAFYMDTGSRKWGRPYLTRIFFSLINETMRDSVVLIMAKRAGRYIAGALNFAGSHTLFGRNWGALEHHPFLHFECCYYQAQDYAIVHGLSTVEAGAQGEHKLARGYLPVKTRSLHYLAHAGLRRAVADYLEHERRAIAQDQNLLAAHAPFRHEED